ncbi:MAG: winged helix-turn-helix transcriptional regulator [Acidimicrobiales bacterium]|nr:winged helix-turn-helix transcriptional regulator [Acidimicrobiales bacterium]
MTEPALSDDGYKALASFRYGLRRFLHFSEEAARAAGLTPAQHQLLLAVRGHDGEGPPTIGEVAEHLQLKVHSTGELVGRTVANGLLERRGDPEDGRRVLLVLTDEGRSVLDRLSVLHRDELRRFHREMDDLLVTIGDLQGT